MDELYKFHSSSIPNCPTVDTTYHLHQGLMERSDLIKAKIANHPLYPTLLSAYIGCRKVGASPEMASVLEEIGKENNPISTEIGTDPELDDFMKSYCGALHQYMEELSKPFDEATNFLSSIGSQLTDLCKQTLPSTHTAFAEWNEAEASCVEALGNGDLKEMLMRKYSGYLSILRDELLKKRKRGKLPKDAISALLEWWNTHYRWPYPTEEEKSRLSGMTGLEEKQINNWFINQRKRHWRPSEDMRFALMEGVETASASASVYFDAACGDHTST